MRLESARALKQELKDDRSRRHGPFALQPLAAPAPVAIGIANHGSGDFRIAIRAREESSLAMREIEQIRTRAQGEVDIKITGRIRVRPAGSGGAERGLRIGASVAHHASTAGTLGCFVLTPRGEAAFVSNNHVLALEDRGTAGDNILHPGPADLGIPPDDVVAALVSPYPLLRPGVKRVDCALATLKAGMDFDTTIDGGSPLGMEVPSIAEKIVVEKIGRTTGRTRGTISAFDIDDLVVDYTSGSVTFEDQIEIESGNGQPFSRPGDSGSVIFTESLDPVALLFAGSDYGGAFNQGLTYANPLQTVLDALGVTLLT
jgi:hypothetical protein